MYLYTKEQFQKFKYKFPGLESINQSYSQALQDMFVIAILEGRRDGKFLEIGADDPKFISNTYLLESCFGWEGISVDISGSSRDRFIDEGRSAVFYLGDALVMDYDKMLSDHEFETQVDYLSIDLEPNIQTLECLKNLPLDKFRFSVITYETDAYDENAPGGVDGSRERMHESREIFKSYGYELVSGNISDLDTEHPFEDWYVDPEVVDENVINKFKRNSDEVIAAHCYMFHQ